MKDFLLGMCFVALAVLPAQAQGHKRYLLRVKGDTATVAQRHGLTVVAGPHNDSRGVALVEDKSGRNATELSAAVSKDAAVLNFEREQRPRVPEPSSTASLNQSTVAILDSLSDRTMTPFYGDSAWSSYVNQQAARIIRSTEAHRYATGSGVVVAIIDTGVDARHPVLRNALMPGYDFILDTPGIPSAYAEVDQSTAGILDNNSGSPDSPASLNQSTVAILDQSTVAILDGQKLDAAFGHGTMVAALVRLVAPTARIMPLRAFHDDGTGSLYDIVRAIGYAVDNGAKVINMSFSLDSPSAELSAAIKYAESHRVICIAAVGNEGTETVVYPAGYKKTGGVASTNAADRRSSFSNYGDPLVSYAAPGENLITAYPGRGYAAVSGTSFSTALVSGAVALLMQLEPNANSEQVGKALGHAAPAGGGMGDGRIDVMQACGAIVRGQQ